MSSKKKVERTPVPYHEWVRMEARLSALNGRAGLQGDDQKKAGRLTREERSELASLKKRCESSDNTGYALLHHCEAITGGVIVPEKERASVSAALKDAYRVSRDGEDECVALENALAALGVAKADIPKRIDEDDES